MMSSVNSNNQDELLWEEYVEAYNSYVIATIMFNTKVKNRVEIVRAAINPPRERKAAFNIITLMSIEEKKQLFSELLSIAAFSNGLTFAAREAILSIPHSWLIENLYDAGIAILNKIHVSAYEEYRGLLGLFLLVDHEMTRNLAELASKSNDPDIKEAGEDFLEILSDNSATQE